MVVFITADYHIAKELHANSLVVVLQYGVTPDVVLVTSANGLAIELLAQLYAGKKLMPPLVKQSQHNLVNPILLGLR